LIQSQVDAIKAEELAKGAFWKAYTDMGNGNNAPTVPNETLDGKVFSFTVPAKTASATVLYSVDTNY
jgi:hypothetical protein